MQFGAKLVRRLGGGTMAAVSAALGAWWRNAEPPAAALEAWRGPGADAEPRRRALAYALTAPNPHNRQPWRVDLREPECITLHCDCTRLLPATDPFGRQIVIGHGAFVELLVQALAEQGFHAEVQLWPQGEPPHELERWRDHPVARVQLAPGGRRDPLFAQVLRRRTPRQRFDVARPVSPDMLWSLAAAVQAGGAVEAEGTVEPVRMAALRRLCVDAARVEMATPPAVIETLGMIRIGPREILAHRDGIAFNDPLLRLGAALGVIDRSAPMQVPSQAFSQAMKLFQDWSDSAMGFVWLSTRGNSRSEQIAAGRAYLRQQLLATERGLAMHPMNQALQEYPEMAPHYAAAHRLLVDAPPPQGAQGRTVQMLSRIGFTTSTVSAAPRRPLEDFLMD